MPFLSLQTMTGEKIETKDIKDKVIVINLWFIACRPCIAELPALNKLVKEYKDKNVVFLGLSTDTKEMLDSDFSQNINLILPLYPMPGISLMRRSVTRVFQQRILLIRKEKLLMHGLAVALVGMQKRPHT